MYRYSLKCFGHGEEQINISVGNIRAYLYANGCELVALKGFGRTCKRGCNQRYKALEKTKGLAYRTVSGKRKDTSYILIEKYR